MLVPSHPGPARPVRDLPDALSAHVVPGIRWWRAQLSDPCKRAYDSLLDACLRFRRCASLGNIGVEDARHVMNALRYDVPEIFWLGKNYEVAVRPLPPHCEVKLSYRMSAAEALATLRKMERRSEPLIVALNGIPDRMRRAQAAHHALIASVRYGDELPSCYSADGPLAHARGVCMGISFAYQYLLNRCDVPCISVGGRSAADQTAPGCLSEHAWNMVCGDQGWTLVDVTADLTITVDITKPRLDYLGLCDAEARPYYIPDNAVLPPATYSLQALSRLGRTVSIWEELRALMLRALPTEGRLTFLVDGAIEREAADVAAFLTRLTHEASVTVRALACGGGTIAASANAQRGIFEVSMEP